MFISAQINILGINYLQLLTSFIDNRNTHRVRYTKAFGA